MAEYGLARKFQRSYPYVNELAGCPVFAKLNEHLKTGKFFATMREDCLDFYYKGQRAARRGMLKYNTNFLDEKGEGSFDELVNNGKNNLDTIIEKCDGHAKGEGLQLSNAFPYFSWINYSKGSETPVLLDVEARFASLDEDGKFDKIDFVFLMPKQKALFFVEGKRQRDPRVRSASKEVEPEVLSQIGRYERQLSSREGAEKQITKAYGNAIEGLREIFGIDLPVPEIVLPKVPILIIGETNPEKDIKVGTKTADKWLDIELRNMSTPNITGDIKCDDLVGRKALLIDGREIFRNPDTQMKKLGDTLIALAKEISQNA